jgi:hypothetical protein
MHSSRSEADSGIQGRYISTIATKLLHAKRKESLIRSRSTLFFNVDKMPLSKRLLYSSLLGVGLAILLVASSVSAMTAYGYSQNHATTQTGWEVSWTILTGPANVPMPTGILPLQSMLSTGSCDLTGAIPGMSAAAGMTGECHILAIVNAEGQAPSICQASFELGPSTGDPSLDPMPFGWAAVPISQSELALFYGMNVHDFRVSSPHLVTPSGFNTGLCSAFLFEGYSADLFVPAHAGHYNFSGVSTVGSAGFNFGAFMYYTAQVQAVYSQGHRGN